MSDPPEGATSTGGSASPTIPSSAAAGSETPRASRRAWVVYGTRFGNSRRLAEALARGLRSTPGVEVDLTSAENADPSRIQQYDLLAVGGPTDWLSSFEPVRRFLKALEGRNVGPMQGFAFDTRYRDHSSGTAGRIIQRRLERLGLRCPVPASSGFLEPPTDGSEGSRLVAGTEAHFERLGKLLGAGLLR